MSDAEYLDRIFNRHYTDKGSKHPLRIAKHYSAVYADLLAERRQDVRSVLELGILRGESLHAWKEYLPAATIVGVDLTLPPTIPGVTMIRADITDTKALYDIGASYGPFDLIVDDASHRPADSEIAFKALYPFLSDSGVYVIEDTHADRAGYAALYTRLQSYNGVCSPHPSLIVINPSRK